MNLHETLTEIRQKVGNNKATSYTKDGCRVSMVNVPSDRVALDVDLAYPTDRANSNQCDFVLFCIDTLKSNILGVPMELKSGDIDVSHAVLQLQDGARIVDNFAPRNIEINVVFVLVHGGGIHRAQYEKLKTVRIRFRGKEFPINTTKCSYQSNLADALIKSTKR